MMIDEELMERMMTAAKILEDGKWADEAEAVRLGMARILQVEAYLKSVIWLIDYSPGKMKDKLEMLADEAQSTLYCIPDEDDEP
jgi:hypothetical protein